MKIILIGRAAVALVAAAALLAGCQGDDGDGGGPPAPAASTAVDNGVAALAPAEILQRARDALKKAGSYRMQGEIAEDGQRIKLDFRLRNADVGGTMAVGDAQVQLLRVAGQQYIKPNAAFWATINNGDTRQAAQVAKLLGDRWAKVPADNKDFAELFSVASVDELLKPDGQLAKGEVKDAGGVRAVGLTDGGPEGGTLYVATIGEPYPVRMEGPTATDGHIAFTDFGAAFADLAAPDPAQVVDFDQLGR